MCVGTDDSEHEEGVHDGGAFHRRAAGDREVTGGVGLGRPPSGLGDVQRHRERGTPELIGQRRVAARQGVRETDRAREELDGAAIHVELLEAEHVARVARTLAWLRIVDVIVDVVVIVDDLVSVDGDVDLDVDGLVSYLTGIVSIRRGAP